MMTVKRHLVEYIIYALDTGRHMHLYQEFQRLLKVKTKQTILHTRFFDFFFISSSKLKNKNKMKRKKRDNLQVLQPLFLSLIKRLE